MIRSHIPHKSTLAVLMVVDSYLPYISGVVTSVAAFARALRADGHRVVIAAPRYPGHRDDDPDVIRLPSLPAPGTPSFRLLVPLAGRLLRERRLGTVDIVHVHGPFLAGTLGWAAARRLRSPLVFTHHTLYDQYVHYVPLLPAALTRPLALRWARAFANRCDLVIAPSEVIRARLRALRITAPIEVLPTGGIDPEQLGRCDVVEVRARYGIPPESPLLVSVSRLAPEKSVDVVLRAFQQVGEPWGAYLLIVGDGPSAGDLRRLAGDLGITGRVRFTGALPHAAALAAMAAGDLFVFASQTETHGVVLVEAMAVGLPVVAVARAGAAEVVRDGEAGMLVEPAPEALAAAVRRLLAEPARRAAMSRRAREIAAGYAVPTLARRLAALYRSARAQADRSPQRT